MPIGAMVIVCAPESFELLPVAVRVVRGSVVDPMMPERGFEYGVEYVEQGDQPHAWYLATRAKR